MGEERKVNRNKLFVMISVIVISVYVLYTTYLLVKQPTDTFTVENGTSYLDEVLISPFVENENALATTSDYLTQCGFNCTARKSELPVRK